MNVIPLPVLLGGFWDAILAYVFLYPVLMSVAWMIGGITFYLRFERKPHRIVNQPPLRDDYPLIAILVPCFNEEAHAEETINALMELEYPNFEVIAINDGSKDRTGEILNALTARYPKLRVVHQLENQGKAVGLNTAAFQWGRRAAHDLTTVESLATPREAPSNSAGWTSPPGCHPSAAGRHFQTIGTSFAQKLVRVL